MSRIFKYDPSKITVTFGDLKFDEIAEVRRSPWRVMLDLRFAELVYRDACEAGTRTAAEVTALLAICNDLRDELALDVSARSHWDQPGAPETEFDPSLSAPTTSAETAPWSYQIRFGAFGSASRRLKRRIWRFLAETPLVTHDALVAEVRAALEERGLEVVDVQIGAQLHDEIEVRYSARAPGHIQTLNVQGFVEI